MDRFRVVAVVDVKGGRAVHAIKGQRDAYAPVTCPWCSDGSVQELVAGYENTFSIRDIYMADLDAIMTGVVNQAAHEWLVAWRSRSGGSIMVDAGITSKASFDAITKLGHETIILGTESIPSPALLEDIGTSRDLVISIDVKDGHVLSPVEEWARATPVDLARILASWQPAAFISLNLSRVGSRTGIDPVAVAIAGKVDVPVLLGGGVRAVDDIAEARGAGLAGVLVATAFLDGSITPADLARLDRGK